MQNIFLISDTHFSQHSILTFLKKDGSRLRPFDSVEEMDETLVENWNKLVRPSDKIYHLGDVAMKKKDLKILGRLNGRKILIRGNHDIYKLKDYAEFFADIRGCHVLDRMVMTHIPIHPDSKSRYIANIHGHTHSNKVMFDSEPHPFYHCVSVEQTNFSPISLEEIKSRILIKTT
tara:strand:+ start:49109 stop:49633 length:525 start_codon:yes stop_codon:yes gene_type:complete